MTIQLKLDATWIALYDFKDYLITSTFECYESVEFIISKIKASDKIDARLQHLAISKTQQFHRSSNLYCKNICNNKFAVILTWKIDTTINLIKLRIMEITKFGFASHCLQFRKSRVEFILNAIFILDVAAINLVVTFTMYMIVLSGFIGMVAQKYVAY